MKVEMDPIPTINVLDDDWSVDTSKEAVAQRLVDMCLESVKKLI